jgi:hypothetical protein
MRWILDLDVSLLVSGIARKHGIVPKTIFGAPSILPPQKKSIFFQEQEISREREFVASQIGDNKKMFLIVQTYLGGQSLCSPHLTPQIQCLPKRKENYTRCAWAPLTISPLCSLFWRDTRLAKG